MFFLTKKRVILKGTLVIVALLLTGCAGMNSKFDCNVKAGGTCLPVHSVSRLADEGAFNSDEASNPQNEYSNEQMQSNTGYPLAAFAGQPIRYGESVQKIWIAPFEDVSGNYHEPSYIYTVVKKGHWIGDPVIELGNND